MKVTVVPPTPAQPTYTLEEVTQDEMRLLKYLLGHSTLTSERSAGFRTEVGSDLLSEISRALAS